MTQRQQPELALLTVAPAYNGFLISHRHTTRPAIATLWPELDKDVTANNLSVTLSHRRRGWLDRTMS